MDERDKQDRHETPSGVRYEKYPVKGRTASLVENRPLWGAHTRPVNQYQSLMEASPGCEPEVSEDEINSCEWIDIALDCLDVKERAVIDLVVFGQMSLSEAGEWLGTEFRGCPYSKQWVAKLRNRAIRKVRDKYGIRL